MDMLWILFQILTFFAVHFQRHLQVLWFLTLHFLMNPSRGAELLHPPRVEQALPSLPGDPGNGRKALPGVQNRNAK